MASIRKRGNSYQITVSNGRDINGKQLTETTTYTPDPSLSPKQQERALQEFVLDFERDVKAGKNLKGTHMTLLQLSKMYLEDMAPPALEKTTYFDYKKRLELRILPDLGHYKITDITPRVMKAYAAKYRKDGSRMDGKPGHLSESTIQKDQAIVSAILSYAVGEGLLPMNILIYAGKQSGRKAKKEYKVKYLSIEQTKSLLWALDNAIAVRHKAHEQIRHGKAYHIQEYTQIWKLGLKWRVFFYFALFLGDRRGENISLTWEDLNLETCEVAINKSTAYANGETYLKDTKTHSSRTAVVPQIVMDIARQWKAEQMRESLQLGTQWIGYHGKDFDKNYVFTQDDGQQMNLGSPRREFKRIISIYNENVAGDDESKRIPDDITIHDLRHTAAAILISNKMDPRSVAGVLGHADPTTTLNIYSYFFKDKNQEAANIMKNVLIDKARL